MSDPIIGIDLGTTNSEVAAFVDGKVRVLGPGEVRMLPSCVGISPAGELLVGESARNQQLVYPERTVRSIKRKMGSAETVLLGDKSFTPQEISALILRELAEWASRELKQPVKRAVITDNLIRGKLRITTQSKGNVMLSNNASDEANLESGKK